MVWCMVGRTGWIQGENKSKGYITARSNLSASTCIANLPDGVQDGKEAGLESVSKHSVLLWAGGMAIATPDSYDRFARFDLIYLICNI